ncbi:MAG: glycogen synthase GlgA [Oxalobacter sp.]|nr:MAG: glycogen synthase GlgA [Oxalobacter sp.]
MRVLHVCTEVYPVVKTGGLADVTSALPLALTKLGCDVRILVPGFPSFQEYLIDKKLVFELPPRFNAFSIRVFVGTLPTNGLTVYFIDAPGLFDRPGNPYTNASNQDYLDNYRRFALLGWIAARLAEGMDTSWVPDVVHAHDWHAGLAPAYLRASEFWLKRKLAGSVFTVHNLAYQGNFPGHAFSEIDLPPHFFGVDGVEFHGQLSFIKAGLMYADKITTVSPTYAKEILRPENSFGLNGVLQKRIDDISGILNGVDTDVWNPAADEAIAIQYGLNSLASKAQCKTALQKETGLKVQNDAPLFCIVSRLAVQKGLDIVLDGLPEILGMGGQLIVLGTGDTSLESAFRNIAYAYPQSVSIHTGYDELKSHRVIAGSDIILLPSRYEPCGLTQLYGLRYGTLPLVHRVGGLADTVVNSSDENIKARTATGFTFDGFYYDAFMGSVRHAFALFKRKKEWQQIQHNAMRQQFTWEAAAKRYLALYEQVYRSHKPVS